MIKCRLRVLLAEHELSQKELAEMTGIQAMTINKMYNNSIVRVPLEAIDKICEALQCDVSDLFKRE
ncbi:MAG: helix-turn-helix transcriptional regulator [Eubacterium sp.]|nr:helix-turn-helix transcriptional regulator [Eubacterium sp.]